MLTALLFIYIMYTPFFGPENIFYYPTIKRWQKKNSILIFSLIGLSFYIILLFWMPFFCSCIFPCKYSTLPIHYLVHKDWFGAKLNLYEAPPPPPPTWGSDIVAVGCLASNQPAVSSQYFSCRPLLNKGLNCYLSSIISFCMKISMSVVHRNEVSLLAFPTFTKIIVKKLCIISTFWYNTRKTYFKGRQRPMRALVVSASCQNYKKGAVSNQLPTGAGSDRVCFGVRVNLFYE